MREVSMTWGKFHKGSGSQAELSRIHRIWVGKSMTGINKASDKQQGDPPDSFWRITEDKVKRLREVKVRWLCEPGQEFVLDLVSNTEPLKTF